MFQTLVQDSSLALPFLSWALLGIFVLILQILFRNSKICAFATVAGLVAMLLINIFNFDSHSQRILFNGAIVLDSLSQIFNLIGIGIVLSVVLMLLPGFNNESKLFRTSYEQFPELLVCLLLSGFGLSVLISAVSLTSLFLGLETLSIGLYCLCGFYRTEIQSTESAFKYLMIGAFSTVIFLYGIAFIYGATGATTYSKIFPAIQAQSPLVLLGTLFLVAGFAFKLAFVPFHLYTADVYEGAPTPITGYLITIVKVGMLAAALRIFWGFLRPVAHEWESVWLGLCVLSIFIGNIGALQQRTIKKLLAFSSIAHAGFLGLALVAANPQGGSGFPLLCYLLVYSSMSVGIFALLTYTENRGQPFLVEDLKGLGNKRFLLALGFAIYIFSLAGLPPFAGFMIKFWVIQSLIEQHQLAVATMAILGSIIGAGYYLKILMYMFMSSENGGASEWRSTKDLYLGLRLVVAVTLLITLLGSIRPQIYTDWIFSALALK